MSSEIELKPCPFCGGEAKPFRHQAMGEDGWRPPFLYGVACSECPTVIKSRHVARTEADMAELWNRRTPPSSATPGEWVTVPREPTPEMVEAMRDTFMDDGDSVYRQTVGRAFAAMLAAAPQPQERAGSDAVAVAYLCEHDEDGRWLELPNRVRSPGDGVRYTPLYTRPQPASDASVEAAEAFAAKLDHIADARAQLTRGSLRETADFIRTLSRALAESRAEAATLHESHRTLNDALTRAATAREAAERALAEAVAMIVELRDYVVNERDAQVLPRKVASYQRELDQIDAFVAAQQQEGQDNG